MSENTRPPVRRALPLILIAIVAVLGLFFLGDILNFESLAQNHDALSTYRDSHYVWAVLIFMGAYIVIVTFSLPGAAVASLAGGFLFGTFPGAVFNILSATIGATFIFLAAKNGLGDRLAQRMDASDGAIKRIKDGIDANQWSMLFVMRLVPVVPFFVANLVPAFVGVPLHRFFISTLIGIIPGGIVYTSVGAGLGEVIARGEAPNLGVVFEPYILLPLLGLAALSMLPVLIKLFSGKGARV